MKIGDLVRFANEKDGGPVHRVVSVMSDSLIELHDYGGYFAPHLFVEADDVADIPVSDQTLHADREIVEWMHGHGLATGHGDTLTDMLNEARAQIRDQERERCAKAMESLYGDFTGPVAARAIRSLGNV